MIDVKKVKAALLKAFNSAEPPPERVARYEPLDAILCQYFNKASHMPRELTLVAIVNLLRSDRSDGDISNKRVREILDQFH